jgi:hypothetical protein
MNAHDEHGAGSGTSGSAEAPRAGRSQVQRMSWGWLALLRGIMLVLALWLSVQNERAPRSSRRRAPADSVSSQRDR